MLRHQLRRVQVNARPWVSTVSEGKRKYKKKTVAGEEAPLTNKQRALQAAISQIEGNFGKGSIMQMGNHQSMMDPSMVIPTGSIALDKALGIGGLARGRIVEIFGPESSGKSTLALHVVAEAQKLGAQCTFIDAEHALDAEYASHLGVNLEELYLSQPDNGEQALEIADTLIRSGGVDVIVVDSVAALTPKAELEGDMGAHHMALQARLMSQALRKMTGCLHRSNTLLVFINQLRSKVGTSAMFGNPEITPGGNALKYYCSIRMDIRKIGTVKTGEDVTGNKVRVKVIKNKLAPPYKKMELEFGKGFSRRGEIIDIGVTNKVITKSGSWYSYEEHRLGQGREQAKAYLVDPENAEVAKEIEERVIQSLSPQKLSETVQEEEFAEEIPVE